MVRTAVQRMSRRAEFWLIVFLAFGPYIVGSTRIFLSGRPVVLTDRWALELAVGDGIVFGLVAMIARVRGWSLRGLGLQPSWRLTGAGLLLYLAGSLTLSVGYALASAVHTIPDAPMTAGSLSLWAVLLVSVLNPIFEEIFVVGYVVRMTQSDGAAFAVTASALLRLLYHTYQGPLAAVCILPLGLIFAGVYVRYGELWPLIVAHAVMDAVGLTNLLYAA